MLIQLSSATAVSSRPSNRRWLFGMLIMVLFLGFFAIQASAQQATIVGTVTDPSGAAVPNAKVTLTHLATATSRDVTTNDQGQYLAADISIGHYNVTVNAQGFKKIEQNGVNLQTGDRMRLDFKLEIGATSEQVTVEAAAVGVQTESGEVSNVITGNQVENLATNGRSIYSLVNLTTGASSLQGDFQVPTPTGGDANVSFNGQRNGHNLYMLDGGEDLDRGGSGTFAVMPSLESIAEFRQLTSNYSAEYGLSSAATMTTVLKSGTKTFHASAWEYVRNDAFDAQNYFHQKGTKVAELRYNTFGFNAGGQVPIAKSQPTFFFYNMEWRKLRQGGTYNQTVPDPAWYGGNLGANAINVPTVANVAPAVLFKNCPGGVAPAGIVQGSPFPNNTIPSCMLDPNAQAMLQAGIFPAPTDLSNPATPKFKGSPATPTNVKEEIVRIDHQFNDKFSIFGHFVAEQIAQGFGTTMWSGDNVPTIGNTFNNPSYSGVVHSTYIISPKLLNELAFNYSGNRINITPVGIYAAPSAFSFNRVYTGPNALNRIPSVAFSNLGTNYQSNWVPWKNRYDAYQIRDDISWSKGAHQLKFGGSWQLYAKVQDLFAPTQGAFNFNGRFTGNDFADFLLGTSNSYGENAVQDSGHWNATSWALYVQDNWRATSRLTLNLGLRWDGAPHTTEINGRESNFYPWLYDSTQAATFVDPTNPNQIAANSPGLGTSTNPILAGYKFYVNGLGIAGQNGTPKGLVANHWAVFGPRIGFAYDLTGNGTTVVRGGFGMMYERVQGNDMYNAGPNQPFSASLTLNDVSLSNPQLFVASGTALDKTSLPILVGNLTGLNADNYKNPVVYQYSVGVQRSITSKSVLSVAYVGSQNRHQNDYREINLVDPSLLPGLVASSTLYNADVPYLGYHSIRLSQNESNGHYNSLQASLNGQVTKDLNLSLGYTLSRTIDPLNGGGSGGDLANVSNPYVGWRYDIGPSQWDRTHIFFANYVYDIPAFRNASSRAVRTIAGGWQISGIVNWQSGAPLNITSGGSTSVCSVVPNCTNRPDLASAVTYPHTVAQWFSTSSFAAPATGTWGNLSNNALRGPTRFNWNMSLFKSFVLSESRGSHFELRADAFNVWNHTQFRNVSNNLQAGDFGKITSAFDPRTFQLGAKLVF